MHIARTIDDLRRTWDDLEQWSFYDRLCAPGRWERTSAVIGGLSDLAERRELTMPGLAIAWVLAQPGVSSAICGSANPAHVRDNSAAAGIALDAGLLAELDALVALGPLG